MDCEETINLQPDSGETSIKLQAAGETTINLQSSDIQIGGGGVTAYDASWLFDENPCTEEHLAELVEVVQDNTPIVVRQGSTSDYSTFTMTVTGYNSEFITVSAVLSMSEQSGEDVTLAIAAPTFTVDRATREVSLIVGDFDSQTIWDAIDGKADYGFYGLITGTNANPTNGATLASGVYKASESQNTSYISLPMEDGTTKRQSVAKGGIVIRTTARLIVLGTQNLVYQYDTGNQYFYEGEAIVEGVIRREYDDGYASLGTVAPPNTYYVTNPINSIEAELNTGDTGHSRITFTVEDSITAGDFYLDITHSSGDDVIWSNGVVPEPAEGETWIFEIYGKTVEAIRFSGSAATLSYNALADKPQITYTGTTITGRVVAQTTVTEAISGTKPIGSYGPFNYIPLDMSSYSSSAASRALIPEDHLTTDGFYVVTASGYMRLGSDSKILKPGTLLYWFDNELYIIGYNACEYWYYDPNDDVWGGGYFTTQEDVEYIISEKMGKWVDVSSGAFLVRNRDNGYYTFSYSSASGTTRRLTISVNGTNTYYYPYNDTALIKSDSGVLMLGRYNLWFAYNGADYNEPIDLTTIQSQLDALDARITALGG